MASPFKKIGSAFSRALHGETPAARQEKERVITSIMQRSLGVYAITPLPGDSRLRYAERLHDALACAHASSLEYLDKKNIVVCLDARLCNQLTLPRGRVMHAIYASPKDVRASPVLMIRDDGRAMHDIKTFSTGGNMYATAPAVFNQLARTLPTVKGTAPTLLAGYYAYRSISVLEWRTAGTFCGEAVFLNSEMLTPPAPSPVPKRKDHGTNLG